MPGSPATSAGREPELQEGFSLAFAFPSLVYFNLEVKVIDLGTFPCKVLRKGISPEWIYLILKLGLLFNTVPVFFSTSQARSVTLQSRSHTHKHSINGLAQIRSSNLV